MVQVRMRSFMTVEDSGTTGITLVKGSVTRGSIATVLFFVLVSSVSVLVLLDQVGRGDTSYMVYVLFGFFPLLSIPVVAWEVSGWMPHRFELMPTGARMVVRGKVRKSIEFGPEVRVDALLTSQLLGPKPKAFNSSCAECDDEEASDRFLILCGIRISKGSDTITLSHEEGWRLIDIGKLWKPFLAAAVENDMEMGDRMWRYIEFCDKVGPNLASEEDDIFSTIREMEV